MLVLTRKLEQGIRIGDSVRITVLRIERGQVRIGIEAPREVSVVRDELTAHDSAEEWEAHDRAVAAEARAALRAQRPMFIRVPTRADGDPNRRLM